MAAYYPAPRRHAPPVPASLGSHRPPHYRHPSLDLIDESPTYIFPSPSSTPPSPSPSPSHSSHFSEHSDTSPSIISFSELGSPETSPLFPQVPQPSVIPTRQLLLDSPDSPQNSWAVVQRPSWEFVRSPPQDPSPFDADVVSFSSPSKRALNGAPSTSSTAPETAGTTFRHPLTRRKTNEPCDREHLPCHVLQRRSLLPSPTPLLSLFSSLLSVEDSTIDLLALRSSPVSVLFPTQGSSSIDGSSSDETDVPTIPHGMEKLFLVATERGYQSVHRGMLSLDDTPLGGFHLTPLPSIWFVVTELVSNGHKLLQRVSGCLVHPTSGAD